MKKGILYFSVLVLIIMHLSSCDLINEPEQIPAYIQIDTIRLETNYETERANSHLIVDAWVFADNQLIGAFELPMKAPILLDGEQEVEVFGGISDNGIRSTPEVYPFYDRFITSTVLSAGETSVIEPTINYIDDVEIQLKNGDFETGNPFQGIDDDINTTLEISNESPFQGGHSGRMLLTEASPFIEVSTIAEFALPDPIDSPMYIELDYKCEGPFEIGLIGSTSNIEFAKIYVVGVLESEEWNKIYINLRADVADIAAETYRIAIKAQRATNATDDVEILIDNIKLLYLKE